MRASVAALFNCALIMCGSTFFSLVHADKDNNPGVYSPAAVPYPNQVFWGDLHVHSNYSFDSYSFGNRNLGPEDAYRFARGETVVAHNGMKARLRRPLDFLLVADHAELVGVFLALEIKSEAVLSTELGQRWSRYLKAGTQAPISREYIDIIQARDGSEVLPKAFRRSVWSELIEIAERNNNPGFFTTFLGYEWSSMIDNGGNLHRVVVFKDGPDKAGQLPPHSALKSVDPEDLWSFLQRYEAQTGGEVLAIPHNGNLSNGLMFSDKTIGGQPITADYALKRTRWEPLYEVTQVKGDSEAHPFLSPSDEFADFETWDEGNLRRVPKQPEMLEREYARSALKLGLDLQALLGVNPFKFGLVGGTDSHTTMSTADDNNFFGKFPDSEPSPERLSNRLGNRLWDNWKLSASGYTGVWARTNTREALFNALKRREVYATTGPRITVRFFGGWDFKSSNIHQSDFAAIGYAYGVPMGGDLTSSPDDRAPTFMVAAVKDPDGANLDRIQIIKGWRNPDGELKEKIYEVVLSDDRKVNPGTGVAPPVGNTVNTKEASYNNSIGDYYLAAVWTDPDFVPTVASFYYARVLEIPTPRWTTYDAAEFKVELHEQIPQVNQERVYTSPIWYTP